MQIPSVPRVTTNAGIFNRDTSSPLTRPIASPVRIATANPTASTMADAVPGPGKKCIIVQPPTIPESPSAAPTERSIPPEMITNVSPIASSSTSVAVVEVVIQLA